MTTITPLPTPAPSRDQTQSAFNSASNQLFGALPTMVTQINTVVGEINAAAIAADASADAAALSKAAAAASEGAAAASAAGALNAPGTGATSTDSLTLGTGNKTLTVQAGKSFFVGASVVIAATSAPANRMSGVVLAYNAGTGELTVDVHAVVGGGIYASWQVSVGMVELQAATQAEMEVGAEAGLRAMSPVRVKQAIDVLAGSKLIRSARTSNTVLGVADKGTLIDVTSGTFTQTFDAAATLGNGWWCYLANNGSGDITLDPNASETIDGLSSYVMYPGEVRLIQCDGAALRSVVLNAFYKVFTASGTFTKPPGYSLFEGLLWSGGASGKRGNGSSEYSGGGGGGCIPLSFPSAKLSATETVTIGAGGLGSATTSGTDVCSVGGDSIFSVVTSKGANNNGDGGGFYIGSIPSGMTPHAFAGAVKIGTGSFGSASSYGGAAALNTASGVTAGNSVYGGASGASVGSSGQTAVGGTSIFGGNGGASGVPSGSAGTAPGGGGGACYNAAGVPGDGARGELRIWGVT